MTEMAHGAVIVQSGEAVLPRWWRTVDRVMLGCVFGLFLIGLLVGFAASPPLAERLNRAPFDFVYRQMAFGSLALMVMLIVSMMSPATVRRLAVLGFLAAVVALALLPAFGTDRGQGAVRWFSLMGVSVQPSEFLKPGFVVFTAWMVAASQDLGGPPGKSVSLIAMLSVLALLAMQPDFGQSVLILFAWSVIYFVAGAPILLLMLVVAGAGALGVWAYNTFEYVAGRVDAFLADDVGPTTQLGFAGQAIREGGLFGAGLGEGSVRNVLPDGHTDFIIAVAAEEHGLVLVLVIIALFVTILLRSVYRLIRERDPFIRLAGAGLVSLFALQAFINLAVAVRLVPAKGMTLPFVSYGGSSLLAMGIAVGMLLCFTRTRPQGEIGDYLANRRRMVQG